MFEDPPGPSVPGALTQVASREKSYMVVRWLIVEGVDIAMTFL